ncbi:FAD-dependent monooxygenase [soil metagenome]
MPVLLATRRSDQEDDPVAGHAVVIAGGGPTGLMLAGELALAGVDVAVVERRPDQNFAGARALGFHARTIEVFDQRGIADRFLSQGQIAQVAGFGGVRLDISDFPTRHPYGLGLVQSRIEGILADWVAEFPVATYYGTEVLGFSQDGSGVDIELAGGASLRASYLVGCDGGRSRIRKAAGIAFPGSDPTISCLIGEVDMAGDPQWGIRQDDIGIHSLSESADGGPVRVLVTERQLSQSAEPTLRDLSEALVAAYGTDFELRTATWLSRFTDMARQAAAYRAGRVLLAGDSAHVHHPAGGQGLGVGVQDAVNLGWKLAQVVQGNAPDTLLDTYHAERHPVAARVLHNTMAQVALRTPCPRMAALSDTLSELLNMEEPRRRFGAMMSGLDIRYDLGDGHPLLGRRMPDLDLDTADGPVRVFELLRDARPVLLKFGEHGVPDVSPWTPRLSVIEGQYTGAWELPVLGVVTAPQAVLIRPDGYVAWVGEGTDNGLRDALTMWFGNP